MGGTLHGIRIGLGLDENWNANDVRRDYEHTATYVIQMDNESDDQSDVDLVTGCPQIGDASAVVAGAICVSRSFREIGPKVWEVEATYSTNYSGTPDENPADSFEWSWSFETVDEPLLFDAQDGSAIQNSAGEGLPPIPVPIAIPVLTIKRYEASFSGSTILSYVNKVNDATFWGASAGKVLCAGISAEQVTMSGTPYWQVTYTFKFKMDSYGWSARILDQGSYYWTGTVGSSTKEAFATDDGKPMIGNLDGSGGKNTTTTPSFVTFERFDEATFTTLGLTP